MHIEDVTLGAFHLCGMRAGSFSRSWQVKNIILYSAAKLGNNGGILQGSRPWIQRRVDIFNLV